MSLALTIYVIFYCILTWVIIFYPFRSEQGNFPILILPTFVRSLNKTGLVKRIFTLQDSLKVIMSFFTTYIPTVIALLRDGICETASSRDSFDKLCKRFLDLNKICFIFVRYFYLIVTVGRHLNTLFWQCIKMAFLFECPNYRIIFLPKNQFQE